MASRINSFLDFNPTVAVVLNAELDHVDYFHDIAQLRASFAAFAERAGESGAVVYNTDDAETVLAMQDVHVRRVTFGRRDVKAAYVALNVRTKSSDGWNCVCPVSTTCTTHWRRPRRRTNVGCVPIASCVDLANFAVLRGVWNIKEG